LIPRPETADVFTRLAELLRANSATYTRPLCIIDLCTGSVPIPLLLKHDLRDLARITGYELSENAIELAKENIKLTNLDIDVHRADILSPDFAPGVLDKVGKVDIIVSNPPYIPQAEYDVLPSSVKEWEDPAAFLAARNGLNFYERIAELLPSLLTSREEMESAGWTGVPRVAVEIGHQQGPDVSDIVQGGGMKRTEVWQDQFGTDRMVVGWDK
jgi:HemK-like putative methylase